MIASGKFSCWRVPVAIPPQTRLGIYEALSPLGVGGMGEVYLAKDTTLGRQVAIKVLHSEFARDPDRLARMEREARLLAQLNHPNIAAIYGLEKCEDLRFLVLELVEGPTLRQRLASGPLTVPETLNIFYQIAQALEAAHEKGIVHRDLKPENIKITPENLVKVLDFGLAKTFAKEVPTTEASQSPTATYDGTSAGVVLGTIPYMSPEQARGQPLDKRTDIWSFGSCLYEALTGRHPFYRETGSDVLAAILGSEPEWNALPRKTPRSIRALLRRCLQKDTRERLHDIADARIELGEALAIHSKTSLVEAGIIPQWTRLLRYVAAGLLGLLVGAFVLWSVIREPPAVSRPVRRFVMGLPATEPLALGSDPALAISPDGTRLVYVARRGDKTQLYMRAMENLEPTPVLGAENGVSPFFSPDGTSVGFFAEGKLKALSLPSGTVLTLADCPTPRGASWGGDDRIVFSPLTTQGLYSVSATGATMEMLTSLDLDREEKSHRWPDLLPGNRAVIFTTWNGSRFDTDVLSLDTGARRVLIEDSTYARYVPTGHLVFVRNDTLFAAPFNPRSLATTGQAVQIIEHVTVDPLTGAAFYAFDPSGLLVYVPGGPLVPAPEGIGRLLSVDRRGMASPLSPTERAFQLPRLSPDGKQLVVTITEDDRSEVRVSDLDRGTMTPLTFEANNAAAIWSRDGRRLIFSSDRSGVFNLYEMRADGSGSAGRLTTSDNTQIPTSFSPDGTLAFAELDPSTGFDLWMLSNKGRSDSFLKTPFNEIGAVFSPDGRWVAYVSDESGQNEVYVREYPNGGKWPISVRGGTEPVWAPNGRELFYRNGEWMMAVSIETQPRFAAATPRPLFEAPYAESGAAYANFDVFPDGNRFIMIQSKVEAAASRLVVVLNWFEELKARVPNE